MHCYPDERYTDFQLSAEGIIAVVVSNEGSNQTLTCSMKAVEADRVTYSTNAVEANPDVLVVAHSESTLQMNSNKSVGSDVTSRPTTYSKTAKPGLDDLYCNKATFRSLTFQGSLQNVQSHTSLVVGVVVVVAGGVLHSITMQK